LPLAYVTGKEAIGTGLVGTDEPDYYFKRIYKKNNSQNCKTDKNHFSLYDTH